MLVIAVAAAAGAVGGYWGRSLVGHLAARLEFTSTQLPAAPASKTLPVVAVPAGLLLSIATAYAIYRLGSRRGFVGLSCALAISFLALLLAVCMNVAPLSETELRFVSIGQIAFAACLTLCGALTAGALVGWWAAVNNRPLS